MKTLYLLRGLPSAGKSTLAKTMGAVNFEADMFFMEGNEYKFDPTKLKQAHQWCQNQVEITMKLSDNNPVLPNTSMLQFNLTPVTIKAIKRTIVHFLSKASCSVRISTRGLFLQKLFIKISNEAKR